MPRCLLDREGRKLQTPLLPHPAARLPPRCASRPPAAFPSACRCTAGESRRLLAFPGRPQPRARPRRRLWRTARSKCCTPRSTRTPRACPPRAAPAGSLQRPLTSASPGAPPLAAPQLPGGRHARRLPHLQHRGACAVARARAAEPRPSQAAVLRRARWPSFSLALMRCCCARRRASAATRSAAAPSGTPLRARAALAPRAARLLSTRA